MVNLVKGQKVDLTKSNPTVKKFLVGLGWNANTSSTGGSFDIDVSAFILGADGKRLSDNHFVFYNNLKSPNESLIHNGDNTSGAGDGDDETLVVELSKLEPEATQIVFVVTIHDGIAKNQNFGQISNSYIRILNAETNQELLKYDLNEDYSIETAMEFGKIYKKDGEFKFEAVGTVVKSTLMTSSSPSPAPVLLSPLCLIDPSDECNLLNDTISTTPLFSSNMTQEASKSILPPLPNKN